MDKLFIYFVPPQDSDKVFAGSDQIFNDLGNSFNFQLIQSDHEQHDLIEANQPQKIFTLGGSSVSESFPVTYLNQKYEHDLLVIWFDAQSYQFFSNPAFSQLDPNQIILAGVKDLNQPITTASCHELKNGQLTYKILQKAKKNIYVHLNFNVLDLRELGQVSPPDQNSIPFETLASQIFQIKKDFNIVGVSIVEAEEMSQYQLDKVQKLILKVFE
jgi:arginase